MLVEIWILLFILKQMVNLFIQKCTWRLKMIRTGLVIVGGALGYFFFETGNIPSLIAGSVFIVTGFSGRIPYIWDKKNERQRSGKETRQRSFAKSQQYKNCYCSHNINSGNCCLCHRSQPLVDRYHNSGYYGNLEFCRQIILEGNNAKSYKKSFQMPDLSAKTGN